METITTTVMQNPSIIIASYIEAAVYGGMKLHVQRGTAEQMDRNLIQIVREKAGRNTVIFCQDSGEIERVKEMLYTVYN